MNEEKLFNIFTGNKSNYHLYKEVKEFVQSEIVKARGEDAAKYYDIFSKLCNSENNAGWEERHSDRVNIIKKVMTDISEDYEAYLP